MTPGDLGQLVKKKYPGTYDQYPDEVVGQRTLIKYPDYQSMIDRSFGDTVKQAASDVFTKPASAIVDLGTNPETMANAMPPVLGTAGAMMPVPGGATMGTAAGQGIRDLALTALKKPVPSLLQHGLELGGAALGDVTAIPAINRSRIGNEIGAVERTAGVPPPQQIPSLPKPMAGQPVSGGLDNTIQAVERAKSEGMGSPTFWKQIKDQVDSFYGLGKDVKLTDLDKGKLKYLSAQVQNGLNNAVPGRAPLAADLARSQLIPNAIGNTVRSVPTWGKLALTGLGGDALFRALGSIGSKK